MRPGKRKYTDIYLPHFDEDYPVTIQDAKVANDILDKNLESLKGKTVGKKQVHPKEVFYQCLQTFCRYTGKSHYVLISCLLAKYHF